MLFEFFVIHDEFVVTKLYDQELFDDQEGCIPKEDWWLEEIREAYTYEIDVLCAHLGIPVPPEPEEGQPPSVVQVLGEVQLIHDGSEDPIFDIVFSNVRSEPLPVWAALNMLDWHFDIQIEKPTRSLQD